MSGNRVVHQDLLKLNEDKGFAALVSFFKTKTHFRAHGYKCGEVYVMPPFDGDHVVLCVHGQVPFIEVYEKKVDVQNHQPVRLVDLLDTAVEVVDSCTFDLKKVGGKRWRLKAENSLKRDEWMERIRQVQAACTSELCLEDEPTPNGRPEDLRALLTSGPHRRASRSQSVDSTESNLYSADPTKTSAPIRIPSVGASELWASSNTSVSSIRSLPVSSPKPIRTRRTLLDMPICPPDAVPSSASPTPSPRAFSFPQSPQLQEPLLRSPQSRFEARAKKFVLDMPIPLPCLAEQTAVGTEMVETSQEFKANRNSNSSTSNRDSVNSGSNQENERDKTDLYGYYGMLKIQQDDLDYDQLNCKQVSLVMSICTEGIKFVKWEGKVWIAGWLPKFHRTLSGLIHIGDQLVAINAEPVHGDSDVHSQLLKCPAGMPAKLVVRPTPHGKTFVLRKPTRGNVPLGIQLRNGKNRIQAVEAGSVASMASLPSQMASFKAGADLVPAVITEVEDMPLDPFARDAQALRLIESIPTGQSFSVVVHPTDFVKGVRAQLKDLEHSAKGPLSVLQRQQSCCS